MTESFILTVPYKNETKEFDAEFRMFGYTHKIMVLVDGKEIIFEPDEERNYRAVVMEDGGKQNIPDVGLLKDIIGELEKAFK